MRQGEAARMFGAMSEGIKKKNGVFEVGDLVDYFLAYDDTHRHLVRGVVMNVLRGGQEIQTRWPEPDGRLCIDDVSTILHHDPSRVR